MYRPLVVALLACACCAPPTAAAQRCSNVIPIGVGCSTMPFEFSSDPGASTVATIQGFTPAFLKRRFRATGAFYIEFLPITPTSVRRPCWGELKAIYR